MERGDLITIQEFLNMRYPGYLIHLSPQHFKYRIELCDCVSNRADKLIMDQKESLRQWIEKEINIIIVIPQYFFPLCVVFFTLQELRGAFNPSHDNSATLMPHKRDIGQLTSFYFKVDMLNDTK